ncbi:MAG: RHS repeat-associated protein, partial [Sediminicola sp.]
MRGEPYQFFLNTPWGENLENQYAKSYTSFSSRFRFNGKEWDEETGNFYYGARYYDPKISVWLSVDPILKHQESPYSFTSNNPIMLIDPDGRDTTFATQQAK